MTNLTTTVSGQLSLMSPTGTELLLLTTLLRTTESSEHDGADIAALILGQPKLIDGLAFRTEPAMEIIERSIALDGRSHAIERTGWLFDRPVAHFLSEMADLAPSGAMVVFDRKWATRADRPAHRDGPTVNRAANG